MALPAALTLPTLVLLATGALAEPRPWVAVRGVYGGVPDELLRAGQTLPELGINAVWVGSSAVTPALLARLKAHGVAVYAEFNTLHVADYLKAHPEAAPVGPDGLVAPPAEGWQGVSPTHEGYRRSRMEAFRRLLTDHAVDGVWLDYHHSHSSWERAEPVLPDTGFDPVSLARFQRETGIALPNAPVAELAALLLGRHAAAWHQWQCHVLTDWVREFRQIRDEVRPKALLGTFHCPWTETERGGALRTKLHIDLRAQAEQLDVFSPMPYHARFGHATEPAWISRQIAWLGEHLGVTGEVGERHRIWPIVQLSDWGETVPLAQVAEVLDHGTRRPATGVMVFAWGSLRQQLDKAEAMSRCYLALGPPGPAVP